MQRLIYTSKALIHADASELNAILAVSAKCNSETGITGMLWADGENFAQVLEGDCQAVGTTMDRIRADPRHTDIDVMLDRPVVSRQFRTWAMVLANDGDLATANTAYLIGLSLGERTPSAEKLRKVILKSAKFIS